MQTPRYPFYLWGITAYLFFCSGGAQAAIVIDLFLRPEGFTDAQSINQIVSVQSGSMLTNVELVLRETVDGGTASLFDTGNLVGADALISVAGSDGSIGTVTTNEVGGFDGSPFDNERLTFASFFNDPGRPAIDVDVGGAVEVREFILGTVSLNAPTSADSVFSVMDNNVLSDGEFGLDSLAIGVGLESLVGGINGTTLTLSATAIPEPSLLAWMGLTFACMGIRRRR